MSKKFIAAIAVMFLGILPVSTANASPAENVTNSTHEWDVGYDSFGPREVDDDGLDGTELQLSDDGGVWNSVACIWTESGNERVNMSALSGGADLFYCPQAWTSADLEGLEVDMYSYIYANGLMAATTYTIANTTSASIDFQWKFHHNYGEGVISRNWNDIYSLGDGTDSETTPAAVAWGPTSSSCAPASGINDGYDDLQVTSESCTISGNGSVSLTFFVLIDDNETLAELEADALAKFDTRSADATLAAGIPSGVTAANWGITGSLTLPNLTDTMTLSGDFALGEYMTIEFNDGEVPYGDYFDIWMCPTNDFLPIDGVDQGDCEAVTFWERAAVANYVQETSALSMTWQISNEAVPGLVSEGGAAYLDSSDGQIMVDAVEGDGGWCQYEGWYLVVNDYDSSENDHGLHSNFSEPLSAVGCSESATLADTGVESQPAGLLGLFALIGGLAVTVIARRRNARAL